MKSSMQFFWGIILISSLFSAAQSAGAFTVYNPSSVFFNATDFDYNSITVQDPMTYSNNGLPVISSRNGRPIFNAGRLSFRDCQAISMIYNCVIQCPTCKLKEPSFIEFAHFLIRTDGLANILNSAP
jgi:hypothetical protein